MRKDIYESPLSSRYASEYMLHLFSPDMRFQTWRRLWVALARAEHELGLPITQEQVDELAGNLGALEGAVNQNMRVINLIDILGDAVHEEELTQGMQADEADAGSGAEYDEHVWLSLKNAMLFSKAHPLSVSQFQAIH